MENSELKELSKPLVEWIRKNGNPHTSIVVTDSHVKVTKDEVGIPFNLED